MLRMAIPVGALLMGVALLLLGAGLLNTLLPLRIGMEGHSTVFVGMVMSGYFVGYLLGTFIGPGLIRRIGQIRAFACGAGVVTCCCILHALLVDPYVWLALRLITGIALVTLYTAIESWLNGQATASNRGQMLALYMIVNLVALALAQQFINLASPVQFVLFGIAAMLMSAALVPVTLTRFDPPPLPTAPPVAFRGMVRAAPIAIAGSLLSGLAGGAFWAMTPVFIIGLYDDLSVVAMFMSAVILGGAALQIPLGWFSDARDRRAVLAITAGMASACALFVLGVVNLDLENTLLLYIGGFFYGGFAFSVYPIAVAHLVDHLEHDHVLDGCSMFLLIHGCGAAIGPIAAGYVLDAAGIKMLPVYFVVVQFLVIPAVYLFLHRVPTLKAPADQFGHYVPMLRTTPAAMEMHPDQADHLHPPASEPAR